MRILAVINEPKETVLGDIGINETTKWHSLLCPTSTPRLPTEDEKLVVWYTTSGWTATYFTVWEYGSDASHTYEQMIDGKLVSLDPEYRKIVLEIYDEVQQIANMLPIGTVVRCFGFGKWKIDGEDQWITMPATEREWYNILKGHTDIEHELAEALML